MTKPLPVIAGGYSCRINATVGVLRISNDISFLKGGMVLGDAEDGPNALRLANAIAARWPTFASVALHTSYASTDVAVYAMGSPLLPASVRPVVGAGGDTGSQAFVQLCALIRQHVTRRGKGSQSRMFLSPISQDAISADGTTLDGAYQSAVIGNYDDFVAGVLTDVAAASPGAWGQVQVSKGTFSGVYGRLFPITGHSIDPNVTSQRRRLGR